ncbi:HIT family protein [Alcaligenes endophyticus]|uniref:HIT family protein n=1 Tax=Alcaligenes endophyticus TaxID=1929088 RepID=A0ABT8ELG6_9BURK|nr:HIT family protein [Alcaligenes endophyticus]MCX5591284.1 HIT family protein [Alcaligenes endophyticus]MDN4122138.1 HIT family protein [Alcaligenes endophyticus]
MGLAPCSLCHPAQTLWAGSQFYVLAVDNSPFPGYTRVVWQAHHAEMSDLSRLQRHALMDAVHMVETTQRELLHTDKINLAQFGNQVPHLHWHIIPRWKDDPYFPDSAWSPPPERSLVQQNAWLSHEHTLQQTLHAYWSTLQSRLEAAFA